jgi:hypothetical protein
VTKDGYAAISDGMSLSEVRKILRAEGEEVSSGGGLHTYSWKANEGFGNMTALFEFTTRRDATGYVSEDFILRSKAQIGLR